MLSAMVGATAYSSEDHKDTTENTGINKWQRHENQHKQKLFNLNHQSPWVVNELSVGWSLSLSSSFLSDFILLPRCWPSQMHLTYLSDRRTGRKLGANLPLSAASTCKDAWMVRMCNKWNGTRCRSIPNPPHLKVNRKPIVGTLMAAYQNRSTIDILIQIHTIR